MHIECGADKERTKHFFSNLNSEGLWDFDYVGLSYYPYWSGTYNLLMDNIINIGNLFHKQVIVVETAFHIRIHQMMKCKMLLLVN